MKFIDSIKTFFKSPEVDPVAAARLEASHDAFHAVSNVLEVAFDVVRPYTVRAIRRKAIARAKHERNQAPLDDPYADEAYTEAVACYSDPADFQPYTEAYLDAHTAAIEAVTVAFDAFPKIFNPTDDHYALVADYYKRACDCYTSIVASYSYAADSAHGTSIDTHLDALRSSLKGLEDKLHAPILKYTAIRLGDAAMAANAITAETDAITACAKAEEEVRDAERFQQKAEIAKTKAEEFLAKANSAKARADEILE